MDFINALLMMLICLLAIPTLVFAIQVLLVAGATEPMTEALGDRPRVAVLIPAHDEALVIVDTLKGLMPQLGSDDCLLVVADNCSDATANLAKLTGATVIARRHDSQRGKGYALDFGLQYLSRNTPPEVVIVIDADCRVSQTCIDTLARRAQSQNRPVQALYLMQAPANKVTGGQAVAEFAWLVKNQVRPLGSMRWGLPCQLMGTGMAFPWAVLEKADLAHGNMVEDMKLGIDLAVQGYAPVFCPSALVTSEFPASAQVGVKQRTRWEHGHLATILAETPRLLQAAMRRRDLRLLAMALDLAVPPLSVLGLAWLVTTVFASVAAIGTGNLAPLCVTAVFGSLFFAAVLSAWHGFGRTVLTFNALRAIPAYMLGKLPIYLAFIFKRQRGWVKTARR